MKFSQYIIVTVMLIIQPLTAHAHLMVAQNGSLNIVKKGAYMVLSVPVSAFKNIDDNGDGHLSRKEFAKHQKRIQKAVKQRVSMYEGAQSIPLEGLIMSPVKSHNHKASQNHHHGAKQIVIMGRFKVSDIHNRLTFKTDLFGKQTKEQVQKMTISHALVKGQRKVDFTPEEAKKVIFDGV